MGDVALAAVAFKQQMFRPGALKPPAGKGARLRWRARRKSTPRGKAARRKKIIQMRKASGWEK
jgi:hypothetical protein